MMCIETRLLEVPEACTHESDWKFPQLEFYEDFRYEVRIRKKVSRSHLDAFRTGRKDAKT